MTPPRTVIFVDLDNTIIQGPFGFAIDLLCDEIARESGLTPEAVCHLVEKENCERQKRPDVPATLAMDWDDIVASVAERVGVKLEASVSEIAISNARWPHLRLLEGADEVLGQLSRPHRAIVAATNGLSKYQIPALEALKLRPLFTGGILTPESYNVLKHERDFYGQWPESTDLQIIVGDDYESDILAPHGFGFKTIWKLNGQISKLRLGDLFAHRFPAGKRSSKFSYSQSQLVRPDVIINFLHELPDVVTRLEEEALPIAAPRTDWTGEALAAVNGR
jgi:FMN phosphatase YigB (HAD superfamily)